MQLLRQVLQLLLLRQGCYLLRCNPSNALQAQMSCHDCSMVLLSVLSIHLTSGIKNFWSRQITTPVRRWEMKHLVQIARQAELQGQSLGLSLQGGLL